MKMIKYLQIFAVGILAGLAIYFIISLESKLKDSRLNAERYKRLFELCSNAKPDTVYYDTTVYIPVPKPFPVVDTLVYIDTLLMPYKKIRYADTMFYDDLHLYYDIVTIGELDELGLGYDIKAMKEIIKTITLPPDTLYEEICRPAVGLYGSLSWMKYPDGTMIYIGGDVSYKRFILGLGYDPVNRGASARVSVRIN